MKKSIATIAIALAAIATDVAVSADIPFALNAKNILSLKVSLPCTDTTDCMSKRRAAQSIAHAGKVSLKMKKKGGGSIRYTMKYSCDSDCLSDPQAFIASVNR